MMDIAALALFFAFGYIAAHLLRIRRADADLLQLAAALRDARAQRDALTLQLAAALRREMEAQPVQAQGTAGAHDPRNSFSVN